MLWSMYKTLLGTFKLETYECIQKLAASQGDHYTTDCLLDYNCFKKYYKMIPIDLSKQQALDFILLYFDFIPILFSAII